jgi:hypothetical protein
MPTILVLILFQWLDLPNWCRCSPSCPCVACDCSTGRPCNPNCNCGSPPTGVVAEKVGQFGERYILNGKPVPKHEAIEAVVAGQLPDDAHKQRLTIIGAKADRDRVLADLEHAELLRSDLVVQDYEPDAPLIRGLGFKGDGTPTIYLQAPSGKVLWRMDRYEGVEPLASAIRRARPDYDPNTDPTGKIVLPRFARVPPTMWFAGAAVIVLLLWRKQS